jgi:hypothetical protein
MGGSGKNESGTRLPDPLGLLGLRATPGNCRPAGQGPPSSVRSAFGPGPYQPWVRRTL